MAGDELCPRPQLNATRAVTVAAGPEDISALAGAMGLEPRRLFQLRPAGQPRPAQAQRPILPQFQHLAVGDWVPMGGKPTPSTAYRVTRLEPGTLMLWHKPGGTWLWLLEPEAPGARG